MPSENFATNAAIQHRNLVKSAQVLLGICSGIIADGQLVNAEIHFLNAWLDDHPEVIEQWPGNVIAQRVRNILADQLITEEERQDLITLLQELTGNLFLETGIAQQDTPTLPVEINHTINFNGTSMCFTGKFLFGTRSACEKMAAQLGCNALGDITRQLDYLVIGTFVSPDWVNTTYGRKIEKAVAYRTEHGRPLIISEKQWVDSIQGK